MVSTKHDILRQGLSRNWKESVGSSAVEWDVDRNMKNEPDIIR